MIRSVKDKVVDYVPPIELFNTLTINKPASLLGMPELLHPFNSEHNKTISWETMLNQISDWNGTLWDKPDWADRPDIDPTKCNNRIRNTSGTVFEYNDVRVNALALTATSVLRKLLP